MAIKRPHFLHKLLSEMRRREVFPVIVTYAVVGWLVLQVAGLTFAPLGLPEWGVRVLIIITISGFPLVFYIAWLIDFKSEGIMFDLPLWPSLEEIGQTPTKSSKVSAVLMTLLVLVGCIGFGFYLNSQFPNSATETVEKESVQTPSLPPGAIAVLAFDSFDEIKETDYFAAGLAEEILNYLSRVKELNVAARTSSFRFKGEQIDIREVAKILNVKHVLEGSVRREGNRVRVSAKLIDGEQGFQAWSSYYERDLDGIFALQQEIAAAVVNELQIVLSVDSINGLENRPSENIDAYIYYLQGREKLRSSKDIDVLSTAKQLFQQAIDIDAAYSRAYAGLCEVNLGLYESSNDISDFEHAQSACEKAESLNSDLSHEVKIALGKLFRYRGLLDESLAYIKSAIALSPASADAYIELGETLLIQGEYEQAKVAMLRAVDLKRNYWKAHEALANYYYTTEQYAESAQTYEIVTRLTPDLALGFGGKGAAYWMAGETDKALTAYEQSLALKSSRQALTNLGISYYYAGNFHRAVEMQRRALELAPDDHRVWGRLAESYRFIVDKHEESQNAYAKASKLAQANLLINEADWLTRAQLGIYRIFLDDYDRGFEELEIALEDSNRNPEALYFKALALLQNAEKEASIDLLEEAVAQDSSYRIFIAMDPDLQILKSNERFKQLLP